MESISNVNFVVFILSVDKMLQGINFLLGFFFASYGFGSFSSSILDDSVSN